MFFKRNQNAESPESAMKAHLAKGKDSAAKIRCRTCESNFETLRQRHERAYEVLSAAEAKHTAASNAFEEAAEAYRDDPSEKNAKAVQAARDRRELAALEVDRPRKQAHDASRDLQASQVVLDEAREEVAREDEALEIEHLRVLSSVPHFHEKALPISVRVLQLKTELDAAIGELVNEFRDSNEVAERLREKGIGAPSLRAEQLISQICILMAEEDPELVEGFLRTLDYAGSGLTPNPNSFEASVRQILWQAPIIASQFRAIRGRHLEDLRKFFAEAN